MMPTVMMGVRGLVESQGTPPGTAVVNTPTPTPTIYIILEYIILLYYNMWLIS